MNHLTIAATLLVSTFSMSAHAFDYFNLGEQSALETNDTVEFNQTDDGNGVYESEPAPLLADLVNELPVIHPPIDNVKLKKGELTERNKVAPAIEACFAAQPVTVKTVKDTAETKCITETYTKYDPMWKPDKNNCEWVEHSAQERINCETEVTYY